MNSFDTYTLSFFEYDEIDGEFFSVYREQVKLLQTWYDEYNEVCTAQYQEVATGEVFSFNDNERYLLESESQVSAPLLDSVWSWLLSSISLSASQKGMAV